MALEPARRYELQAILEDILGSDQVHFQPPPNVLMVYPAIVYTRGRADTRFADNKPYRRAQSYTVTVIHHDPDNSVREKVADLPYCSYERWFPADGLNHDVYNLFF